MNQQIKFIIEILKDVNDVSFLVETNKKQSLLFSLNTTTFPVKQIISCESCNSAVELGVYLKESNTEEIEEETELNEEYLEEVEELKEIVEEPELKFVETIQKSSKNVSKSKDVSVRKEKMCHICSKLLNPQRLKYHLRAVHGENGSDYRCEHCTRRFKDKATLKIHLIERHFPQLSICWCDFCGKGFASTYLMGVHITAHHSIKKPTCTKCFKEFNSYGNLKHHLQTIHGDVNEKKKYPCPACGKIFFRKSGLTTHGIVHMKPEEYQLECQICGKVMAGKYKLNAHMKMHFDGPPTCQFCLKTFNHKSSLKEHLNIHTVI